MLVTGATGRIGRALRAIWGTKLASNLPIIWQSRDLTAENDLHWDIGKTPSPPLPMGLIVLHLAGKTSGSLADLDQNAVVTQAVCQAAVDAQARHIVVMSSAAVYAPGPLPLHETDSPGPVNAYGASKLAAEQMAQHVVQGSATRLTILRLANLAGADALLGAAIPGHAVTLDPIAGQCGGPERSYIGPRVLAQVLADLVLQAVQGADLPLVVNLAQQPPVAMADLLQACGQDWRFGPPRAAAVGRVVLNTDRLATLTDLPHTSAAALIADLRSLPGWPR
ncbi:MAG: SDR family oxidoreductase [Alphaproteobacteria bacterium]